MAFGSIVPLFFSRHLFSLYLAFCLFIWFQFFCVGFVIASRESACVQLCRNLGFPSRPLQGRTCVPREVLTLRFSVPKHILIGETVLFACFLLGAPFLGQSSHLSLSPPPFRNRLLLFSLTSAYWSAHPCFPAMKTGLRSEDAWRMWLLLRTPARGQFSVNDAPNLARGMTWASCSLFLYCSSAP